MLDENRKSPYSNPASITFSVQHYLDMHNIMYRCTDEVQVLSVSKVVEHLMGSLSCTKFILQWRSSPENRVSGKLWWGNISINI